MIHNVPCNISYLLAKDQVSYAWQWQWRHHSVHQAISRIYINSCSFPSNTTASFHHPSLVSLKYIFCPTKRLSLVFSSIFIQCSHFIGAGIFDHLHSVRLKIQVPSLKYQNHPYNLRKALQAFTRLYKPIIQYRHRHEPTQIYAFWYTQYY